MLLIVAGHCIPFSSLANDNSFAGQVLISAIFSGSSIFVLISGFFFYHVFYSRFNYQRFLKKKIRNIVSPYLFMSIIVVVLFRLGHPDPRMGGFFQSQGDGFTATYLVPFVKYLVFGGATTAYWYIPFIFLMFCLSPLHKKFSELDIKPSLIILILSFFVSMLVLRSEYNLNVFQSLAYYHFFYLAGILFSKYYQFVSQWLVKNFYWLLLLFISADILMAYCHSSLDMQADADSVITLRRFIAPFKFLEFLVLYSFFERFPAANTKPLSWFADMSFAVYFIHPIVIAAIKEHWVHLDLMLPWLKFWLSCLLVITICMLMAFFLKKMFGDRTRLFVGW